jgi:hypothetical protein
MDDQPEYRSLLAWARERSTVLVIACADGRWRPHIQDFVTNCLHLDPHFDMVEVPGGVEPLTLVDLVPKDFNFLRRRIDMLVRTHGIRRIVMIAHENCGWYRERRIGAVKVDLRTQQIADLRRVRLRAHELFGDAVVETYYARLASDGSQVVFEAVE